jgi:signal transduction histidine kinase
MRRTCARAILAGLVVLAAAASASPAPPIRHILILQSLDRGSLVFDRFTANFRAALQERAGDSITVFEFVVAPAGFATAPEKPTIDFLQAVFADRPKPDLIVTVGGPAAAFVRRHRQELFPETPVLFASTEIRFLRDVALLDNETAVTVSIDYARVVDDILQLLPHTRHIFMVTGAGAVSRFWRAELGRNFESYRNRVTFLWSDDLSYTQVLQRTSTLPPDSAIFYISAGTFATGGWQSEERTFAAFARQANAPVFSAQLVWLGAGIVGGHLLDIDDLGPTAADVAVRVLNGEAPASIRVPPTVQGGPIFDARQLRRWHIPESRLPPGSEVRFQGPSLWHDYRRETLIVLGAIVLESVLIVGLLYERRARRRAEIESRRNLALAADANRREIVTAMAGSIAHELSQPLSAIEHNARAAEILASNGATAGALSETFADIREAAARAAQVIQRQRRMLRNRPIAKKPVDIHGVVRDSVAFIAHATDAKQVRVDVHLPSGPCVVVGDQVLLQQVLVNLMMNAVEAMADTPVERRRLLVETRVAHDNMALAVRDAGTGLPASSNEQLFEPFVTTKRDGLGIGLTIARTIVEAHLGTMDARNNPDGGATFTITLPFRPAFPASEPRSDDPGRRSRS